VARRRLGVGLGTGCGVRTCLTADLLCAPSGLLLSTASLLSAAYPYGYAPGYYGYGGQSPYYGRYPAYGMSMRPDPNNCGTPDEPKPCTR
jgi:hypothetical protein